MKSKNSEMKLIKECIAELFGTLVLCGFGNASIAVKSLAPEASSPLSIHFSWGIGACFGVYLSKSVSGGHINPAVTIAKALTGQFPLVKVLPYIISQCLGAFISSVLVYLVYMDMEKTDDTATIFATYPRDQVTTVQALLSSIIGTYLMVNSINAVTTNSNSFKPLSNLEPLFLGLAVFVYGITFSVNTGYAINPARDIGPRVFIYLAGWSNVFTRGNDVFDCYWWVPLVGPIIGAALATLSFQTFFTGPVRRTENDETLEKLNEL